MAEWHANAKLRLHTDSTVATLKELTRSLGSRIRHFAHKVCPLYDTRELPREEAARARRRAKKAAQGQTNDPATQKRGPLRKVFNLVTYKLHALGDYVAHILRFGTTDSYSTQTVREIVKVTIGRNSRQRPPERIGTPECQELLQTNQQDQDRS